MDKKRLEEFAKEIEMLGYDRGVKTILEEILKTAEQNKYQSISYKSIKEIYNRYQKINEDIKLV